MTLLNEIAQAVLRGNRGSVEKLVTQAIEEGYPAQDILDKGLVEAMDIVGGKYDDNEISMPTVLVIARALNVGTTILRPKLIEEGSVAVGKAVIGTVKGDMHDIGKNLVRIMIEGKGIEIADLGVDVEPEMFVNFLSEHPDVKLVCYSALLSTTLPALKDSVKVLRKSKFGASVKVLVGGAPVTQEFADTIGADGYAPNATSAAEKALALLTAFPQ